MKVLAIGAHPDDMEIYMFGTLAAYRAMGAGLHLAIATDGARGGVDPYGSLAATRQEEARAGAALLGIEPEFLDFPDGGLVPDQVLVQAIKALIERIGPDLVMTHAPDDYHGDHRALSQAVALAASFAAPVLYADCLMGVGGVPDFYVDISSYRALKEKAILFHKSQDPERFITMTGQWDRFRASQCNFGDGHAEAFRFAPIFPFADIRGLLPPSPPVRPLARRDRQVTGKT